MDRLPLSMEGVLEWNAADKCALVAVIGLIASVVWAVAVNYLFLHPDFALYANLAVLRLFFKGEIWVFIPGWLVIIVTALCVRWRWPNSQLLVHLTVQFYTLTCAVSSYFLGHHTSNFGVVTLVGGATVGLLLFERRPVLLALLTFLAIMVATTLAEQARLIPYAPALLGSPFENGRLATTWLINAGGVTFFMLLMVIGLIYYGFDRLRAQELRLAQTTDQLARANDLISRYVAAQVAEQILSGNYSAGEKHERRKLTLFFSDIKDFSEVADSVEPEELSQMLNEYLSEMTSIAERYGGTIDKFVGDAIMIFFGAPLATDDRDHALRAVRMGMEMQKRLADLRRAWIRRGIEHPFQIRIGINTGVASVGNFGSKGRMDYTAIGRHVNLAARLQVNCEPDRILLGHATWVLVQDDILCTPKGEIRVKGIHNPVKVYEVAPCGLPE